MKKGDERKKLIKKLPRTDYRLSSGSYENVLKLHFEIRLFHNSVDILKTTECHILTG